MSDISRNAFIESLTLPNLPIPTIQATPLDIAIEIDPETVYSLHSSPEPTPIPLSDNNNEVTFPKPPSPHSGLTILHAFRTGGTTEHLQEAAQDITHTFTKHIQDYEKVVADLRRKNAHKKNTIAHLNQWVQKLRN